MVCPACGMQGLPGASFCTVCGARLVPAAQGGPAQGRVQTKEGEPHVGDEKAAPGRAGRAAAL